MYVVPGSFVGPKPGLSITLESMSYTDMNEGMWFSYILGPAVDGILDIR